MVHYLVTRAPELLEQCDSEGHSPLHWAAFKNYLDIARYLITSKANLVEAVPFLLSFKQTH